jgi:Ca2+-binding EF-hand superfamily protein
MHYAFGDFLSQDEVRDMLEEADTDHSNTIELNEFIDVIKKHRQDNNP